MGAYIFVSPPKKLVRRAGPLGKKKIKTRRLLGGLKEEEARKKEGKGRASSIFKSDSSVRQILIRRSQIEKREGRRPLQNGQSPKNAPRR